MADKIEFRLISEFIKIYDKENKAYDRELKKKNKATGKKKKSHNVIQLWYAFNGTGKTRFSVDFDEYWSNKNQREISKIKKQINEGKINSSEKKRLTDAIEVIEKKHQLLYYNAYTEDLFSWDNESREYKIDSKTRFLDVIAEHMDIKPDFERDLIDLFQSFTQTKIQPTIDLREEKIIFTIPFEDGRKQIKISRGEERIFVWTLFFVIMKKSLENLKKTEDDKDEIYQKYANLEYILIDDPISSLDDNNSIIIAISMAELIKKYCDKVKFVIVTHHTLFYSILLFELKNKKIYKRLMMKGMQDKYYLKNGDEKPFSNHLFNLIEIGEALESDTVSQKHFAMMRSTLEKTATFLHYNDFTDLLKDSEGEEAKVAIRTLHSLTHGGRSMIDSRYIVSDDIDILKKLYNSFKDYYHFKIEDVK